MQEIEVPEGKKNRGAEWIKKAFGVTLSPFGEEVAFFLDVLGQGIYHFEDKHLRQVQWNNDFYIFLTINRSSSMATYDFDWLTRIVVLSHDLNIRVEISPTSPQTLQLHFHRRYRDHESVFYRMPSLTHAVTAFRDKVNNNYE